MDRVLSEAFNKQFRDMLMDDSDDPPELPSRLDAFGVSRAIGFAVNRKLAQVHLRDRFGYVYRIGRSKYGDLHVELLRPNQELVSERHFLLDQRREVVDYILSGIEASISIRQTWVRDHSDVMRDLKTQDTFWCGTWRKTPVIQEQTSVRHGIRANLRQTVCGIRLTEMPKGEGATDSRRHVTCPHCKLA